MRLIVAFAEQPEQIEEQVDKVEIERQGTHNRKAPNVVFTHGLAGDLVQSLSVVGGQPGKNQHTKNTNHQIHETIFQENIDEGGDTQPKQRH